MIKSLQNLSQTLWRLGLKESAKQVLLLKEAGKKEELIEQYPDFEAELVLASNSVKPGWLNWVVVQLQRNEPIREIISMIGEFEKFKPRLEKKDLYQYESLGELRGAIEEGGLSRKQKKQRAKEDISGDYEIIYEDENYLVVHPQSKEASCYFGQGTKWCVSATVSENFFNEYAASDSFLYFILSKHPTDDNLSKIAYLGKEVNGRVVWDIYNALDKIIKEVTVFRYLGDIYPTIRQKINQHFNSQETTKLNEIIKNTTEEDIKRQLKEVKNPKEELEILYYYLDSSKTPGDVLRVLYFDIVKKYDLKNEAYLFVIHKNTPSDVLLEIWNNNRRFVEMRSLINHPNVSTEILEDMFFAKNSEYIRNQIIAHHQFTAESIRKIMRFITPDDVPRPSQLSDEKIRVLLEHPNPSVRYRLFSSDSPKFVVQKLLRDPDELVRYQLAIRSQDPEVLEVLSEDSVRHIANAARAGLAKIRDQHESN